MKSRLNRNFRRMFAALPARVRRQAREAYWLFQNNPAHPGLHFKMIYSDPLMYSARVGIGHRAVCVRKGDSVVWFWIGSHALYDQLLARL